MLSRQSESFNIADTLCPRRRFDVAEGSPSITGGMSEHRFRMRSSDVEAFADSLKQELAAPTSGTPASAVARDLTAHRGASIVIAR